MERKRILIAEHETGEVQDLRNILIAQGYEVKIVENGSDALNYCQQVRPHLILTEVSLPEIDGHHLLRELKSHSSTRNIPIIFMSAHRTVDDRVHSMNLGVDDYITRPFDANEVLLRIENILNEYEGLDTVTPQSAKGFSGRLSDMPLVDLLWTLEIGKKTGIVKVQNDIKEGIIYLKQGQVINVSLDDLPPKIALMKMFVWNEGTFQVEIQQVESEPSLVESTAELIRLGTVLREQWLKISENLPPLSAFIKRSNELTENNLTENEQKLINLLQGHKRILEIIDESEMDDLEALKALVSLYNKGSIVEVPFEEQINGNNQKKAIPCEDEKTWMTHLLDELIKKRGNNSTKPKVERRRGERRQLEDRRVRMRRWTDIQGQRNHIYLSRSELLMIRQKLVQQLNSDSPQTTNFSDLSLK